MNKHEVNMRELHIELLKNVAYGIGAISIGAVALIVSWMALALAITAAQTWW
jgi:hypothetical protein